MADNRPAIAAPNEPAGAVEVVDAELVDEVAVQLAPPPDDAKGAAAAVRAYLDDLDSAESRRTMRSTLDKLAAMLSEAAGEPVRKADEVLWHRLTAEQTSAIRAAVVDRYSPSTAKRMMSGLSRVLHQCWRLDLMTWDHYQRAKAWQPIKGKALEGAQAGRHVESGELRAIFLACATDPNRARGARDAALMAVLYGAGARRAEAVSLDVNDFDLETGNLRVRGKGGKWRVTYCVNGTCDALTAWLEVRGNEPGPLFLAVNKGGRIDPALGRLTTNAVYLVQKRLAEDADVREFMPHDLRRTFIGDMLDAGVDIATVQQMVGHASAAQTAKYDRRGEETKRRAARMLHVPYVSPDSLATA